MKSKILSWLPLLYLPIGVFLIVIMIRYRVAERPYAFYYASIICFMILFFFVLPVSRKNISGLPSFFDISVSCLFLSLFLQETKSYFWRIFSMGHHSWVVPIISYFHGKSYLTGKAGRKNFSLFFSGLVLSFVLGFVFGVLALVVAVASEYAYPVHYPFMSASWLIIASYIFLLESNIWDFGSSFDSLRRLLVG